MLNIENELFENLDSHDILPIDNDSFEVSNIIKDYNLEHDKNILNTIDSQYEVITKFIIWFYLEKEDLPNDLKLFVKNSHNYRIFLLENIKLRMKNIVLENSVHLFKEIFIILNLLSNGNRYDFLTLENMFSIEDLHKLLNDYEDNVCEQFIKEDQISFQLSFKYYLTLLEVLNEICIINSLDIQRRRNINSILELITNTISNMKSKISLVDEHLNSLNAILGKLLLNFTNMTYISIDSNNKNIVIQKYLFMLNKIYDGYNLLKLDQKYYFSFLDKVTTLILTLMYKLETKLRISKINLNEYKELEEIYNTYNKVVDPKHNIEAITLDEFRTKLLINYNFIYENSSNNSLNKEVNLIDHFISLNEISNVDMIIIHNLILFSSDIPKEKLDLVIKSLFEKNKFDNDYYELYKLKIIDRILQKYILLKIETSKNELIKNIIKYIEANNLISHLMSMYAKIYLSLSLYYSYENQVDSQEMSKKFYFIYQRLDNNNSLDKEFHNISKQILYNYARNYLKSFNFRSHSSYSNNELVDIGKDLISKYIEKRDLEIKNDSLLYIEKLNKEILQIHEPNDEWLNKSIESLITEKIFFGSVKAKIENVDNSFNNLEIGFEKYIINIEGDYSLVLYYSSYYKLVFENILNEKKEFLELIVRNLFRTYINSIPSYTDTVTKLPNINKLKTELRKFDDKTITFFEVYLDSVVRFSEVYNIETSNQFFKEIALKINEEVDTFRLFGPKVGIILEDGKDYKELVSFLQEMKVSFDNEEFELKPIIAVSTGKANKILDKSFYALSSAKISNDKLYLFE